MTERFTDAVIVGAGPAGAATALFLARRGYAVTLVDRAAFPRSKPCGEYLTPGAVLLLRDEIGVLPKLFAQGAVPLTRETVVPHDGRAFGADVSALACPRAVTDSAILNAARAAGVTVREGFAVRRILFDGARVAGIVGSDNGDVVTVRGRVTVGADGTHSLLARSLGVVRPIPRLQRIALVGHFREAVTQEALTLREGGPHPAEGGPHPAPVGATLSRFAGEGGRRAGEGGSYSLLTLARDNGDFSEPSPVTTGEGGARLCEAPGEGARSASEGAAAREPGVAMHLPRDGFDACCGVGAACGPDGTRNVNIVVPVSEAGRMAGRRDNYFSERLRCSFPAVWEQVAGAQRVGALRSVPCFGHHTKCASAHGAVLVGDAATFIHPFTGEGVYFALRGAMLAAEAIDGALQAGDCGKQTLARYDRARRRELLPRYRLCDAVQRVVHSPRLLAWAAGRLRASDGLTRMLLATVGDVCAPRELASWRTLRLLAGG